MGEVGPSRTWSCGVSFKVSRQFKLEGKLPSHSSGGFHAAWSVDSKFL